MKDFLTLIGIHILSAVGLFKTRVSAESDNLYYCYRCFNCNTLLTKIQMQERWAELGKDTTVTGSLCQCGGNKVTPNNALWYEELFLPRMWRLRLAYELGKVSRQPEPETFRQGALDGNHC